MIENQFKTSSVIVFIIAILMVAFASITIYAQEKDQKQKASKYGTLARPSVAELEAARERSKYIKSVRDRRVDELNRNYEIWIKNSPNVTNEV